MSFLELRKNGTNYSVPKYGELSNLKRITQRNMDNFRMFFGLGNRVVPNQNPLVNMLQQFSIDDTHTPERVLNKVIGSGRRIASAVNFTSLYNKGDNLLTTVYPEENHMTMIVVPFDQNNSSALMDGSGSKNKNIPASLKPIFTTSVKQYWNLDELLDSTTRKLQETDYTVLQLDILSFVMGYRDYLVYRKENRIDVGLSPHHYVALVLLETYIDHNNLVVMNYTADGYTRTFQNAPFAFINYDFELGKYVEWKRRMMRVDTIRNFSEYMAYAESIMGDRPAILDMVLPDNGKSGMFVQLSWIYTLGNLYWSNGFLELMNFMGNQDPDLVSRLRSFFKVNPSQLFTQPKNPFWIKKLKDTYAQVKEQI